MKHTTRRRVKKRTRRAGRKPMPWAGWAKLAPQGRQRTTMYRRCGKKCFLGTKRSNKNIYGTSGPRNVHLNDGWSESSPNSSSSVAQIPYVLLHLS